MSAFPGPYRREGVRVQGITHGQWLTLARVDAPRLTEEGRMAVADLLAAAPAMRDALAAIVDAYHNGENAAYLMRIAADALAGETP